jgi:hypothetical protein
VSAGVYPWFLLLIAACAANLPFVSERVLGLFPARSPKAIWARVGELLVFYGLTGAVGMSIERSQGQIAPQSWEFYAITFALFLTLAFPGFVYRYLLKHGRRETTR